MSQGTQPARSFTYDSLQRLTQAINPESGTVKYSLYDANSNLLKKTDANGTTTTFTYDALNRVLTKNHSDGTPTVTYHYDNNPSGSAQANAIGELTSVASSVSAETYDSYDALGRVLASTQTTNTIQYPFTYTYNLAGGMITEKYPSGDVINTSYDAAGRINQVNKTGGPAYASGIAYTPSGAVQSTTLGNRLIEQTMYNSRLQPVTIQLGTAASASSVLELDYGFNTAGQTDNNGNVLEQKIKIGTTLVADQTYGYDQVNRLQTASETSGGGTSWSRTFGYDAYGNMWVSAAGGTPGVPLNVLTPTAQSQYNADKNQLLASTYDPSGNQRIDANGNQYNYDANNLMTSCTVNGVQSSYTYDGNGKRITKTVAGVTTLFVYNVMGQLAAEYGGPAPTTGGTSYLTTDHLGSTRVTTDSNGAVRSRDDYLPFGEEIGAVGTGRGGVTGYSSSTDIHQKFTSKERDTESNLDFFDARYFSSAQGRFTSPDEFTGGGPQGLGGEAESRRAKQALPYADIADPRSLNRYQYCLDSPLRHTDPTGHIINLANGNDQDRREAKSRLLHNLARNERRYFVIKHDKKTGAYSLALRGDIGKVLASPHTAALGYLVQTIRAAKTVRVSVADKFSDADGEHASGPGVTIPGSASDSGQEEVYLGRAGLPKDAVIFGKNGRQISAPRSIIAAHEVLGHARLDILYGEAAGALERPTIDVENEIRRGRGLAERAYDDRE